MIKISDNLNHQAWLDELNQFPEACRDIYFASSYHNLHVANKEGIARCTVMEDGNHRLLVPGLAVTIPQDAGGETAREYFDLQTCNGYGGPIASSEVSREFLNSAWAEWKRSCAASGVIAGFFRLHPILDNARWLPDDARIIPDRKTVFLDFTEGLESLWTKADSKHRNMVNKGRREGIDVGWNGSDRWREFEQLYGLAMARLNAPASLRFSPAYFSNLQAMPDAELAWICLNGKLAAASVFLNGARWTHYHISARADDSPNHLTNCLLQAAMERAAKKGLKGMHLGGGRSASPTDSLLKFKLTLGGTLVDFKVALVVADQQQFDHFTQQWVEKNGRAPQWLLGYRQTTAPI